jgi:hypothetical protein
VITGVRDDVGSIHSFGYSGMRQYARCHLRGSEALPDTCANMVTAVGVPFTAAIYNARHAYENYGFGEELGQR